MDILSRRYMDGRPDDTRVGPLAHTPDAVLDVTGLSRGGVPDRPHSQLLSQLPSVETDAGMVGLVLARAD